MSKGAVLVVAATLLLASGCRKPPVGEADIAGKLEDSDGKPLAKMIVRFHPQDEANKFRTYSAPTKADGTFVCRCLPGRYKATLASVPNPTGAAPADGKGAPAATRPRLPDTIPPIYGNPAETPLEFDVPPGGKSDIVLTVQPAP
jgi:hypothetical protein